MTVDRIGPGLYADASTGELHFDLVEACQAFGWKPTEDNQELAAQLLVAAVGQVFPMTVIDYENDGAGAWRADG